MLLKMHEATKVKSHPKYGSPVTRMRVPSGAPSASYQFAPGDWCHMLVRWHDAFGIPETVLTLSMSPDEAEAWARDVLKKLGRE